MFKICVKKSRKDKILQQMKTIGMFDNFQQSIDLKH